MKKIWTKEEEEYLRQNYRTMFASEIAEVLGRSTDSVQSRAYILRLHSDREKRSRAGKLGTICPEAIAHRFQKGLIPANKGKKMSPEVYAKAAPTMFKKGQIPHNYKEVGTEIINADGYVQVKVADPNVWKLKHRLIWEQAHGEIPEGYNVQFKNHNPLDIRLENLYLISKAEQMGKENSYMAKYPKDLQEVIRLKGAVKRAIRRRTDNGK